VLQLSSARTRVRELPEPAHCVGEAVLFLWWCGACPGGLPELEGCGSAERGAGRSGAGDEVLQLWSLRPHRAPLPLQQLRLLDGVPRWRPPPRSCRGQSPARQRRAHQVLPLWAAEPLRARLHGRAGDDACAGRAPRGGERGGSAPAQDVLQVPAGRPHREGLPPGR